MAIDNTSYYAESLYYLYTFNLDMGDSLEDVAEWLCDCAGIDYGSFDFVDNDYVVETIEQAIEELLRTKSKEIPDTLYYLFTEEHLVEDIFYALGLPTSYGQQHNAKERERMLIALNAVNDMLSEFPNGARTKKALEDNILSELYEKG